MNAIRSDHTRELLPALCAMVVLVLNCTPLNTTPVQSKAGTTTTIILVRHCERDPGFDPPLNAEGQTRAQNLLKVCQENGVTAIYAADFIRNRQSVQPLADALGLQVNIISQLELADTKAFANNFVDTVLANNEGGVVMWNGNTGPITPTQSGNLQELYARLGGTGDPPIRYQDFYIAVIPEEGPVHFIKSEYGGKSSLD
jgi:hypothetical protein